MLEGVMECRLVEVGGREVDQWTGLLNGSLPRQGRLIRSAWMFVEQRSWCSLAGLVPSQRHV